MTPVRHLPPLPENVPVLVESSFSNNYGPEHHGIDTATQWWCEAVHRPRSNDCIARVTQPGAEPYTPLVTISLPADDLDDTESAGRYAVNVTRWLVELANDRDNTVALAELKILLSSSGPMADASSPVWHRVLQWLTDVRDGGQPALDIAGNGWPQTWTVTEVAEYLGYSGESATGSARKQLSRWKLESVGRQPGKGGQSLYPVDQVRAAHAHRPGRGHRTDLDEQ